MNKQQISRWISMAEATVRKSLAKQVYERAKSGKCLHCDDEAGTRGLCVKHYTQFYRSFVALPKSDRPDFEMEAIAEGKILASGKIRELTTDNPFASPRAAS